MRLKRRVAHASCSVFFVFTRLKSEFFHYLQKKKYFCCFILKNFYNFFGAILFTSSLGTTKLEYWKSKFEANITF